MNGPQLARAQIVMAAVLFSTGGAAIKAADLSGMQVACFRSLIAAATLAILIPGGRRGWSRRTWMVAAAFAVTLILFVTANKQTTAANTIFLQMTAPLYLLLIGPLFLKERFRPVELVTVAIMIGAISLFFLDGDTGQATAPNPALGNALALCSGVGWALTISGLRWLARDEGAGSAAAATVAGNLLAGLVCLPFALPVAGAGVSDLAIVAYLGIVQIGFAYVALNRAMPTVPALQASLLLFVEPALNPIWAWLVHGETPGPFAIVAMVLILAVTLVWSLLDARRSAEPAPA